MSQENPKRRKAAWGCIGCLSVVLVAAVVVGAILSGMLVRELGMADKQQNRKEVQSQSEASVEIRNLMQRTELPEVIVTDETSAVQALQRLGSVIGFDSMEEFGQPVRSDTPHYTYYRFAQRAGGMNVYGHAVILGVAQDGTVCSLAGNYVHIGMVDAQGRIEAEDVGKHVRKVYGAQALVQVHERCIYLKNGAEPVCAWRTDIYTDALAKQCFVSVKNGEIIGETDLYETLDVAGHGKDETDKDRRIVAEEQAGGGYLLKECVRNIEVYDAQGKNVSMSLASSNVVLRAHPNGTDYYTFIIEDGEIVATPIIIDGATHYVHPMRMNDDEGVAYLYETPDGKFTLKDDADNILSEALVLDLLPRAQSEDEDAVVPLADEDNLWKDKTAVSAKYCAEQAYDLYANVLGRRGFDGRNSKLHLTIRDIDGSGNVGRTNYLYLGDARIAIIQLENGVAVDLNQVGHEYTHAVIKSIVGPGRTAHENDMLEEGLCDFFGELTEDYSHDHLLNNSNDWVNSARSMVNPLQSEEPAPGRYKQEPWYFDKMAEDKGERDVQIHQNSTVLSHALYRMSMGVGQDEHIEPVGNFKLAQIVYDAIHNMTGTDGYAQFADILRHTAFKMCADGYITEEQARCVYIALENALLYPTFTVAPDAVLTFHDLKDTVLEEYDLYISKADFDARPMRFSDDGEEVQVQDGAYPLALEENESYRIVLRDRDDPTMVYTASLKTKASGAAKVCVETDIFHAREVVNNGGRYVGCGTDIYYWKYNKDSFEKTGLVGYFPQIESSVNQLVRRSADGTEVVIRKEAGFGNLYIAGGRIYYHTPDGMKSCDLEGKTVKSHIGDFSIEAVDSESGLLIYRDQQEHKATRENQLYIEQPDGTRVTLTADHFDSDGQMPVLLAVGDGQIYYARNHDNRDGKHGLIVLGADMQGNTRLVGIITYSTDDANGVEVTAQLVEDTLYVSYALYRGSGMYYDDGGVAAMNTARDEASEILISQSSGHALYFADTHVSVDPDTGARTLHFCSELGPSVRDDWVAQNVLAMDLQTGSVAQSTIPLIKSGDCAVMEGSIVTVTGTDEKARVIASAAALKGLGYVSFDGAGSEKGGYMLNVVDVMGDLAFIEITEIQRNAEDDVGWRYNYRRAKTVVYVTRIGSDELRVLYTY